MVTCEEARMPTYTSHYHVSRLSQQPTHLIHSRKCFHLSSLPHHSSIWTRIWYLSVSCISPLLFYQNYWISIYLYISSSKRINPYVLNFFTILDVSDFLDIQISVESRFVRHTRNCMPLDDLDILDVFIILDVPHFPHI